MSEAPEGEGVTRVPAVLRYPIQAYAPCVADADPLAARPIMHIMSVCTAHPQTARLRVPVASRNDIPAIERVNLRIALLCGAFVTRDLSVALRTMGAHSCR